jgi:hypothetical protein
MNTCLKQRGSGTGILKEYGKEIYVQCNIIILIEELP